MSNRKLTKFPVIAENGTEFRVTLKEDEDYVGGPALIGRIYIPRKRFGYRKLYETVYRPGRDEIYRFGNPDYIAIARQVYSDWIDDIDRRLAVELGEMAQAQRKSAAIDAFQAWDGHL
ncbi:hypothetical protein [Paenibacillus polysaccharolyticus]|uniref:hypothetical protein n=1 Tax=Paenibacillus polysaccharolyticus TaxID=582692 RepID=UPI00300967BC